MSNSLGHSPNWLRRWLLRSRVGLPFPNQRETAAEQPGAGCSFAGQLAGNLPFSAEEERPMADNLLQRTAKTANRGLRPPPSPSGSATGGEDFVDRCRAAWREAGLELTEQERFDLAE